MTKKKNIVMNEDTIYVIKKKNLYFKYVTGVDGELIGFTSFIKFAKFFINYNEAETIAKEINGLVKAVEIKEKD